MEDKDKIPEDIQKDANKLFKKPDRSDCHTDTEYENAVLYYANHESRIKDAYIKGRMDERTKQQAISAEGKALSMLNDKLKEYNDQLFDTRYNDESWYKALQKHASFIEDVIQELKAKQQGGRCRAISRTVL